MLMYSNEETVNAAICTVCEQAFHAVLAIEGVEGEATLHFTDGAEIRELNHKFRNKDSATDVLSFPSGEEPYLGDIILNVERAYEQATLYDHSPEREFGFLTAHSALHLLGYDHETSEEEQEMIEKQEKALQHIGLFRKG